MSNFISRLLKGTAGISLNNSFECQSFVELNPTVNRRSTDSHSQCDAKVGTFSIRHINQCLTCLNLFTRLAALVALLFIVNIGDVWGYSFNYPHLYFYNSSGVQWDETMFFMYYHRTDDDKKEASQGFNMSTVEHTKLWYVYATENRGGLLSGFNYGFGATKDWGWQEGNNWDSRWGYLCEHYAHSGSSQTNLPYGTYLCTSSGSDNLSVTQIGDNEAVYAPLNHKQTVKKVTTLNGTSFSEESVNCGTVTISAYQLTGNGTASNEDNSATLDEASETSDDVDAAYTGEVTLSATANTGYVFLGWYDAINNGSKLVSSTYNAPNSTKTVYARFAPKFATGKTYYLVTNSNWENDNARFAAVFGNATTQTWVDCSTVVADEIYSVNVPEGDWGYLIFCRMNPTRTGDNNGNNFDNANRWNQTSDMMQTGAKNCVYITGNGSNNQRWGEYAPLPAIAGMMNNWDPVGNQFSGTPLKLTMDLPAGTPYNFKVALGKDDNWYGHGASNNNDLTFAGQTNAETLTRGHRNMMLLTAKAGTYTFEWDATNEQLTITFPETSHPSLDYVYMEKYSGWNSGEYSNIHYWDDSSNPLTSGSEDPKMTAYNYFTDKSLNYYIYPILTDYPNFKAADGLNGGTGSNHTNDMDVRGHAGQYTYWGGSSWVWGTFTVRIQLNDLSATTAVDPTYQDIAFNSAVLTDLTSVPAKTHYDFGGFYTDYDSENSIATGTQVIDAEGKWIAGVADYTDEDKHWIHAGTSTTLYAKWTEHEYAVTIAVTGSGSTSPANSTTAKYVTESGNITATPSTGWHFRDWAFTKTENKDDIWCADPFESTNATIHIKAQHDGTLTAHFDPTNYVVRLEDKGADEGHKGTPNVSVTYGTTTGLTSAIECPQKNHYDFGGYWISSDGGTTLTTQLINADGTWKKNISGYTGVSEDNPTWVCAGDTTLYAKWTEHAYTVTASVSPAGAGSVNTITDAHLTIPSSTITATPVNAAWVFDHWVCGDSVGIESGSGTNAVTVTAAKNSTITAYFKKRYDLVGSNYDKSDNAGMPGWDYGNGAEFTINSYTADGDDANVDMTYTCMLNANTKYKFEIHDRKTLRALGKAPASGDYYTLTEEIGSVELSDQDREVYIDVVGAGQYTFKITHMRKDGDNYYPTITILRPQQVNFGQKYKDIDGQLRSGTTGGTASATAGEDALTSGDYVTYNTYVTHDESAATGYTFAGWWSTDAYTGARFSNVHPMPYYVTRQDNAYALFTEDSTHVHFANDGHGHVTIGGETRTDTIVGITTHRTIVAVPDAGYKFSSWDKTSGSDYDLTSTSTATTTLSGKGEGATSGQTITANFNERWSIKGTMNGEDWGTSHTISNIGVNANSKDTGYVEMILPANTTYEFAIYDEQTGGWLKNGIGSVFNMTYAGNHANWHFGRPNQNQNCGITTAGAGTYRFIFNITDTTVTVVYPTSYLVNLGVKAYTIEGTVEGDFGGTATATASEVNYPNGSYIASGASVTILATPSTGYDFKGWYNSSTYNSESRYETNTSKNWEVGEAVNAYAKFVEKTNTFNGSVESHETEWSNTGNWSAGHLPTINEVAIIQKPVVVDITDAKAKRVILDQNSHTGSLTIDAGKELVIATTLRKTTDGSNRIATAENDLVFNSDASNGLGALVMGSHDGTNKATVNFYSKSYGKAGQNTSVNQYLGTPFNDETNILYNWYNSWIYKITYTNNVPGWTRVNDGEGMTPFYGYSVISADGWDNEPKGGHVYWQQGTLVASSDHTCSDLNYQSGTATNLNNENLLANSWMAPIKIKAMQTSDFVKTEATIYIFNSTSPSAFVSLAGNYTAHTVGTSEGVIPAMQSFSVFTNASGGSSVTLDYSKIVYEPAVAGTATPTANHAPQRRTSAEEANKLRLFVQTESGYGDMVYMWERSDFAEGFENGWDGHKLFGEAVAPQLFAVTPDGNMAVNCVPDFEGTLLGFQAGTSDNVYTFTFEYSDGAEELYLRDMDNNTYTRVLSGNSYLFTTSDRDIHNRFILTKNAPLSPTGIAESEDRLPVTGARKFIKDDMLYIFKDGKLYNATGVLVR